MNLRRTWSGSGWSIEVGDRSVRVRADGGARVLVGTEAARLEVRRRWLRWQVHSDDGTRLRGLSGDDARALRDALARFAEAARLAELRSRAEEEIAAVLAWHLDVARLFEGSVAAGRWIAYDDVEAVVAARPAAPALATLAQEVDLAQVLSVAELAAYGSLSRNLWSERARANPRILSAELTEHRGFFDTIEKSPLTDEQARAVVTFDNRVQVVAAAGSGKTSVMVARAAYAIKRGFVPAERILVLAFNANAATELQARITSRLTSQGIDAEGLRASTFHSFGLSTIGAVTGIKPRLAPWLDGGQDLAMTMQIVDELRDASTSFRYRWDLFRLLFARSGNAPDGGEGGDTEWWDPKTGTNGFLTFRGETVKSHGERLIADWLHLNGIAYRYEQPYAHPVADATHSQYQPDFYYPDIDVWHEHWAIGTDGKPPAAFTGYAEGMAWKKGVHRQYGTSLVETTWAEIVDRSGFEALERELTSYGLELDWNPERPATGARPVEHQQLAQLVRSFMQHVKAGSIDRRLLEDRASSTTRGLDRYRTRLFLDLYWGIHDAWQRRLDDGGYVDFEDMLVRAADLLEGTAAEAPYDMVLVDEFQDSSAARARLVRSVLGNGGKYLLTVGDDWQSIYRFAGSDVSVMTDFERWFGPAEMLRLQTTFRSTQAITDLSSTFVSRNPRQLRKTVRSAAGPGGPPVGLVSVVAATPNRPDPELQIAVSAWLQEVSRRVAKGEVPTPSGRRVSVDVLGRYRFESKLMPPHPPRNLDVTFRTVHSAKGLEADFVLIPRAVKDTLGFPSQVADDPLLDLVMADPDPFPHGEERRLFYVALTRARCEVAILTVTGKESPFVVELVRDGLVTPLSIGPIGAHALASTPAACPTCGEGMLVPRRSRYGEFWGCARFPSCRHTQNRAPVASH